MTEQNGREPIENNMKIFIQMVEDITKGFEDKNKLSPEQKEEHNEKVSSFLKELDNKDPYKDRDNENDGTPIGVENEMKKSIALMIELLNADVLPQEEEKKMTDLLGDSSGILKEISPSGKTDNDFKNQEKFVKDATTVAVLAIDTYSEKLKDELKDEVLSNPERAKKIVENLKRIAEKYITNKEGKPEEEKPEEGKTKKTEFEIPPMTLEEMWKSMMEKLKETTDNMAKKLEEIVGNVDPSEKPSNDNTQTIHKARNLG